MDSLRRPLRTSSFSTARPFSGSSELLLHGRGLVFPTPCGDVAAIVSSGRSASSLTGFSASPVAERASDGNDVTSCFTSWPSCLAPVTVALSVAVLLVGLSIADVLVLLDFRRLYCVNDVRCACFRSDFAAAASFFTSWRSSFPTDLTFSFSGWYRPPVWRHLFAGSAAVRCRSSPTTCADCA